MVAAKNKQEREKLEKDYHEQMREVHTTMNSSDDRLEDIQLRYNERLKVPRFCGKIIYFDCVKSFAT